VTTHEEEYGAQAEAGILDDPPAPETQDPEHTEPPSGADPIEHPDSE